MYHETTPKIKVVIVEEELNGIDRAGIENFENFPRLVLIDEKCGNLKVVFDDEALARTMQKKKKPDVLQAYTCPLSDKCHRQECFFNKYVE